ncbi:MAG TPA: ribulose-phosphate 3-epimerase [Anaerolineaceae bacterium]|nr:ribulose-phosphate 3-epimerase [Anaerolineaceae bacterium]HQF45671.1 ribulose-phosphate 3-epimerase [Anaerolineaceae bacterium]HQH36168.1 ribulose-phosphate 3-epimerase [Anaerolineaceae bacterium]HQJ04187.1 ribulose-phosphate 3-epimerase [Anaerolineaceae bacterium]
MENKALPEYPILTLSILGANWLELGKAVEVADTVRADAIQVDIADGHFIPTITLGERLIQHIRQVSAIPLEVHLMVARPQDYFRKLAEYGANSVLIHPESTPILYDRIMEARSFGLSVGVALNVATPVEVIEAVLPYVDMVTLMAISLGYSGTPFVPTTMAKITRLRAMIDATPDCRAIIQVDGGIKQGNVHEITAAGMDNVLSSSAVYNQPDPVQAAKELRAAMHKLTPNRQRNLAAYLDKIHPNR